LVLTSNRSMQDCFRQHPEMYGSELEDDEEELEEEIRAQENAKPSSEDSAKLTPESTTQTSKEAPSTSSEEKKAISETPHRDGQSTPRAETQKAGDEGGELVPKAAYDATSK
jgi:mitochondrial intermembrane space import and assembly protein 40